MLGHGSGHGMLGTPTGQSMFDATPRQSSLGTAAGQGMFGTTDGQGMFGTTTGQVQDGVEMTMPRVFSSRVQEGPLRGPPVVSPYIAEASPQGLAGSVNASPYGDPCWVTVFGFPGRAAQLVRQQLEALCGPIVEVRYGDGNFMHVRFHTATAASQCLAHNGHALLGKMLIGCIPCASALANGTGALGPADVSSDGAAMLDTGVLESEMRQRASGRFERSEGFSSMGRQRMKAGPHVVRFGLWWRILDLIFDI